MSDLRHAICVHFDNLLKNFDLNEDYNRIFLSHFNKGTLPDEWHQYLLDIREDKPEDLDAWIAKKYPDRSAFNTQTKEKIFFGDLIYNTATETIKIITMQYNPLWKPEEKPSGKSMADFFRAVKTLIMKKAFHSKALDACRKHKNTKSGEWGDAEKVKYIVDKVNNGMATFDPETQHPTCWLAWLMCSHPIDYFIPERKLSLSIAVPPQVVDNGALIPGKGIRHIERAKSSLTRGTATSTAGGKAPTEVSADNTTTFVHKIQIIPKPDDERELHHQQIVIDTLRGTIDTLRSVNAQLYEQQIQDLNTQLVDALLQQVELLRVRSDGFREARLAGAKASIVSKNIVQEASNAIGLSSPLMRNDSSMSKILRTTPVPTNTTLVMSSGSGNISVPAPKPFSRRVPEHQSSSSSTTVSWVSAEHFNEKMHFAYGYPNDPNSWMLKSKPNFTILQIIQNLRNSLQDRDDRWQVEIWIKRIAEYLDVPDDLIFDERDTYAAVPDTLTAPSIPQEAAKAKKRCRSATTVNAGNKKHRGGATKKSAMLETSDEDTTEPDMPKENDNESILDEYN